MRIIMVEVIKKEKEGRFFDAWNSSERLLNGVVKMMRNSSKAETKRNVFEAKENWKIDFSPGANLSSSTLKISM